MKKITTFSERLKEALASSGLRQIDLANMTGISKSLLNKYIGGITEAGNDKLYILASALNVNPVWLMGYDVEKRSPYIPENALLDEINDITIIKEKKDKYVIDIDLPGYEKEGIKLNIQDGYLTVHAVVNKDEKDEEKGKFVRRERFSGECSRSFYVGENVTEDEIKAKFKNGTLTIEVPKKEEKKELPEKKYIPIE